MAVQFRKSDYKQMVVVNKATELWIIIVNATTGAIVKAVKETTGKYVVNAAPTSLIYTSEGAILLALQEKDTLYMTVLRIGSIL